MAIAFKCPTCEKKYKVSDALAGKVAGCPCGSRFKVPMPASASLVGETPPPPPPASDPDESDGDVLADDTGFLDQAEASAAVQAAEGNIGSDTDDFGDDSDDDFVADDDLDNDLGDDSDDNMEPLASDTGMDLDDPDDLDGDGSATPTPTSLDAVDDDDDDDLDSDLDDDDDDFSDFTHADDDDDASDADLAGSDDGDEGDADLDGDDDAAPVVAAGGGWPGRGLIWLGAACLAAGLFAPLPWLKGTAAPTPAPVQAAGGDTTGDTAGDGDETDEDAKDADAGDEEADLYIGPGLVKMSDDETAPTVEQVIVEVVTAEAIAGEDEAAAGDDAATDADDAEDDDADEESEEDGGATPVVATARTAMNISGKNGLALIGETAGKSPLVFMLYGALGVAVLLSIMAAMPGKILSGKGGMIAGGLFAVLVPGLLVGGLAGIGQASGSGLGAIFGNAAPGLFLALGGSVLCLIGGVISALGVFQGGGGAPAISHGRKTKRNASTEKKGGRGKGKGKDKRTAKTTARTRKKTKAEIEEDAILASAETQPLTKAAAESSGKLTKSSKMKPAVGSVRSKPGVKRVSFAKKGKKPGVSSVKKKAVGKPRRKK